MKTGSIRKAPSRETKARNQGLVPLPLREFNRFKVGLRHVLVPIDFSTSSKRALVYALPLARVFGARVTLLHVAHSGGEPPSWVLSHLERGVATLQSLDVESEFRIRTAASPLEGIREEESATAPGLVVIGGHGPAARSRSGTDDITRQVLRFARSPVLVVPENA